MKPVPIYRIRIHLPDKRVVWLSKRSIKDGWGWYTTDVTQGRHYRDRPEAEEVLSRIPFEAAIEETTARDLDMMKRDFYSFRLRSES